MAYRYVAKFSRSLDLHPGNRVVGTVISIAGFPWIWTFSMGGVSVNRVCPVTLRSHTKVVLLLSTFASDFADRFDLLLSMCDSDFWMRLRICPFGSRSRGCHYQSLNVYPVTSNCFCFLLTFIEVCLVVGADGLNDSGALGQIPEFFEKL